jgi:hypothetical protein
LPNCEDYFYNGSSLKTKVETAYPQLVENYETCIEKA